MFWNTLSHFTRHVGPYWAFYILFCWRGSAFWKPASVPSSRKIMEHTPLGQMRSATIPSTACVSGETQTYGLIRIRSYERCTLISGTLLIFPLLLLTPHDSDNCFWSLGVNSCCVCIVVIQLYHPFNSVISFFVSFILSSGVINKGDCFVMYQCICGTFLDIVIETADHLSVCSVVTHEKNEMDGACSTYGG
jgi:hypothetical protein